MNAPHLYPPGDMWGYYGKGLWGDFVCAHPELADHISGLYVYMPTLSTDPVLASSDHVEHKWFRIACLLGLAEWPETCA